MNSILLINEKELDLAKEIFKDFRDLKNDDRIIANTLGSKIAINYFENYNVDAESDLHNIGKVLQNIDISDIYVNENYIDVRLYFNENELSVPKSHFDYNVLPVAYMFIKLNEDITEGTVTGFIKPADIDTSKDYNGYYQITETELLSFYDIEPLLTTVTPLSITSDFEKQVYDFIDGILQDYSELLNTLITSRQAREFLYNVAKASQTFEYISNTDLEDSNFENLQNEDELVTFTDLTTEKFFEDNIEELSSDNDELGLAIEDISPLEEIEDLGLIETNLVENSENGTLEDDFTSLYNEPEEFIQNEFESLQEEYAIESETIENTETNSPDSAPIIEEFNESDFTTNTTPSLVDLENELENDTIDSENEEIDNLVIEEDYDSNNDDEELVANVEKDENLDEVENDENLEISELEIIDDSENNNVEETSEQNFNKNEEINDLFSNKLQEESDSDEYREDYSQEQEFIPPKRKSILVPIIGILIILTSIGYGISKINTSKQVESTIPPVNEVVNNITKDKQERPQTEEAMPTETIESSVNPVKTTSNEGNAVAIPAIEQNLDASILVSNLSVNWEVPSAYISNPVAKRYFTKLGKIIQLNLKTELLLLSKPPITNKIAIELEFNSKSNAFDIKDLTASSGETIVDEVVKKAVKNALNLKLSTNMSVFNTIQGNPTLVIRL